MSRTFRHRHGFNKPSGVNYTESSMRHRDRRLRENFYAFIAHEVCDFDCVVGTKNMFNYTRVSHDSCIPYRCGGGITSWRQTTAAINRVTKTWCVWSNPYLGYGARFFGGKIKEWRTTGNRSGRHHTHRQLRQLLSISTHELSEAYDLHTDDEYVGFIHDSTAAVALERPYPSKHQSCNRWDLT